MASPLRLQVHGAPEIAAALAWAEVQAEFAASDLALSRHRADSELTELNRHAGRGHPVAVGWRLYEAIAAAVRARRRTGGRFDARVLRDLERLGDVGVRLDPLQDPTRRTDQPSTSVAIDERWPADARGAAGEVWRAPRARVLTIDTPFDLGGIGKGLALRWAADRAARVLGPMVGFLLEAGGDLVMRGSPSGAAAWMIGVEDPAVATDPRSSGSIAPLAVIRSHLGAVSTSSVARRRWLAGDRLVHHLLDPLTGEPGGTGLTAVTVAWADPAWAEIWSKALFLEGARAIGDAARARGLAAWWVTTEGELRMTPAARLSTVWTRDDAGPDPP